MQKSKSWKTPLILLRLDGDHFACRQQICEPRNAGEFYFDVISSKYEEAAANSKIPASCTKNFGWDIKSFSFFLGGLLARSYYSWKCMEIHAMSDRPVVQIPPREHAVFNPCESWTFEPIEENVWRNITKNHSWGCVPIWLGRLGPRPLRCADCWNWFWLSYWTSRWIWPLTPTDITNFEDSLPCRCLEVGEFLWSSFKVSKKILSASGALGELAEPMRKWAKVSRLKFANPMIFDDCDVLNVVCGSSRSMRSSLLLIEKIIVSRCFQKQKELRAIRDLVSKFSDFVRPRFCIAVIYFVSALKPWLKLWNSWTCWRPLCHFVSCLDILRWDMRHGEPKATNLLHKAFIMWQAYWTLDVEEWQNGWKAGGLEHGKIWWIFKTSSRCKHTDGLGLSL